MAERSLIRASRIRPLTVPSGAPRMAATWRWVWPPKYASVMASRCGPVSSFSERASCSRSSASAAASWVWSHSSVGGAACWSRAVEATELRTRSMARRRAIIIAQPAALPLPGSKCTAVDQSSRNTSWATSSDWAGSRSTVAT
jgi:hypothetical protein